MLASDLMLPHYIPFLLSKISAKQLETKVDALEILQQIVITFKPNQLALFDPQGLTLVLSETSNVFLNVIDD